MLIECAQIFDAHFMLLAETRSKFFISFLTETMRNFFDFRNFLRNRGTPLKTIIGIIGPENAIKQI